MLHSPTHNARTRSRDSPSRQALSRRFVRAQQRDLDQLQRLHDPRAAYLALVLSLWREAGA
jgi:hypothetical protein